MQNTQINSHLNNETILTKKDNTILINDPTNRLSDLKNSQILQESVLPNEGEKSLLKNPEISRHHILPTDKNTLPSQNNVNNYNPYSPSPEDRRRNRNSIGKTENSIMQNGINCISPKFNNGHYKSLSKIENQKYGENYLNTVEDLKENIESPRRLNRHLKLGLKYNEIPRIDDKKYESPRMYQFCNSMEKSIKHYKKDSENKKLDDIIDEENLKLQGYMNNMNKFMELRKSNSMVDKYPNLMDLQKMKKLKHHNLVISNNRYMGERYDPQNYS